MHYSMHQKEETHTMQDDNWRLHIIHDSSLTAACVELSQMVVYNFIQKEGL